MTAGGSSGLDRSGSARLAHLPFTTSRPCQQIPWDQDRDSLVCPFPRPSYTQLNWALSEKLVGLQMKELTFLPHVSHHQTEDLTMKERLPDAKLDLRSFQRHGTSHLPGRRHRHEILLA